MSNAAASEPISNEQLLSRIVERMGGLHASVQRLDGGEVNFTYRVKTAADEVVIRFPVDRLRGNEFPVEMWASRTAAAAGIPVARGLSTGEIEGVPYIVSEYRLAIARPSTFRIRGAHQPHFFLWSGPRRSRPSQPTVPRARISSGADRLGCGNDRAGTMDRCAYIASCRRGLNVLFAAE